MKKNVADCVKTTGTSMCNSIGACVGDTMEDFHVKKLVREKPELSR